MGINKPASNSKPMSPAAMRDYQELRKNLSTEQAEVLDKGEGFVEVPATELRRRRCSVYAYLM